MKIFWNMRKRILKSGTWWSETGKLTKMMHNVKDQPKKVNIYPGRLNCYRYDVLKYKIYHAKTMSTKFTVVISFQVSLLI